MNPAAPRAADCGHSHSIYGERNPHFEESDMPARAELRITQPTQSSVPALGIPRVVMRRRSSATWDDILAHAESMELELPSARALNSVNLLLRRYQRDHSDAYFTITVLEPCLVRIDRSAEPPTNPMTGKPCAVRLDAVRPVDEDGVVNLLLSLTESFGSGITRRAFLAFLEEQFEAHVLKVRREGWRLGLDYAAMKALAHGMFQNNKGALEHQALKVLGLCVAGEPVQDPLQALDVDTSLE